MEIIGKKRKEFKKKAKSLKEQGLIPGVIFGKGFDSLSITLGRTDFVRLYKEAGDTSLIDVSVDGEKYKVLVKEVQLNPVTDVITHVGFYKPNLKEKISAQIPVEITNEEDNELVSSGEGMILTLMNEIEVEALPTDLPQAFNVDVSKLIEIDQSIPVSELEYDREKVEIKGLEEDTPVVKIGRAEIEEEEEEEVTEEEALEGIEATEEKEGEEGEETEKKEEKEEKEEKKEE